MRSHSRSPRRTPTCRVALGVFVATSLSSVASGATLYVDDDDPTCAGRSPCFATIQAAIDAALTLENVSVAPGFYDENIDFVGKEIVVASEQGPDATVIDGGARGPVVTFASGETPGSVLMGFRIQNGLGGFSTGGGVSTTSSSPTVMGNVIANNVTQYGGGGVSVYEGAPILRDNVVDGNVAGQGAGIELRFSSAIVEANTITNNARRPGIGGPGGGGIMVGGTGAVQILDNLIAGNSMTFDGGGITLWHAGTPILRGNVIRDNTATGGGGGIWLVNASSATIVGNLIVDNVAVQGDGGGILDWANGPGSRIVGNTIAGNQAQGSGSAIFSRNYADRTELVNNLIVGPATWPALIFCDGANPLVFEFNDVFTPPGNTYGGTCADQTGLHGNISADPLFADPDAGDYHLLEGSPAIDAGDDQVAELLAIDIDGQDRVIDGDGDDTPDVDMGADEYVPPIPVEIDIRPLQAANIINPNGTGLVPVVLFGAPDFDVADIDPSTVAFGPAGAPPLHTQGGLPADFDQNGITDLLATFAVPDSGIAFGDTQACVVGQTLDATPFEGCGDIQTASACGLGFEAACVAPLLGWVRRRWKQRAACSR